MDESVLYPDVAMILPPPPAVPEGEEREALSKNPFAMLKLAMDRRRPLPEDLHKSMMLWSFHPDYSLCVQAYLSLSEFWHETNRPAPSLLDTMRNLFSKTKRSLLWIWSTKP